MNGNLKRTILFAAVLLVSLFLYSAIKGILEGEEGRIKRLIYSAKRTIEKEKAMKCISYVSFDYADEYGNDRSSLFLIAKSFFVEYDDISITINDLKIKVKGEDALAEIEGIGYGRRSVASDVGVLEYDKARFKVKFKKEEGRWKIIGMEFLEPKNFLIVPGIA